MLHDVAIGLQDERADVGEPKDPRLAADPRDVQHRRREAQAIRNPRSVAIWISGRGGNEAAGDALIEGNRKAGVAAAAGRHVRGAQKNPGLWLAVGIEIGIVEQFEAVSGIAQTVECTAYRRDAGSARNTRYHRGALVVVSA